MRSGCCDKAAPFPAFCRFLLEIRTCAGRCSPRRRPLLASGECLADPDDPYRRGADRLRHVRDAASEAAHRTCGSASPVSPAPARPYSSPPWSMTSCMAAVCRCSRRGRAGASPRPASCRSPTTPCPASITRRMWRTSSTSRDLAGFDAAHHRVADHDRIYIGAAAETRPRARTAQPRHRRLSRRMAARSASAAEILCASGRQRCSPRAGSRTAPSSPSEWHARTGRRGPGRSGGRGDGAPDRRAIYRLSAAGAGRRTGARRHCRRAGF